MRSRRVELAEAARHRGLAPAALCRTCSALGAAKGADAIALCGVFQYQPESLLHLDEVDAPLDDANVVRFTS